MAGSKPPLHTLLLVTVQPLLFHTLYRNAARMPYNGGYTLFRNAARISFGGGFKTTFAHLMVAGSNPPFFHILLFFTSCTAAQRSCLVIEVRASLYTSCTAVFNKKVGSCWCASCSWQRGWHDVCLPDGAGFESSFFPSSFFTSCTAVRRSLVYPVLCCAQQRWFYINTIGPGIENQ